MCIRDRLCIGKKFGVNTGYAIKAISKYTPKNSRSQLIISKGINIILDAYNANPTSMHEAITAFSKRKGKKALILGHMAELGVYEAKEHKVLVKLVNTSKIETCYWVGKPYKQYVSNNWFISLSSLKNYLKSNPIDADEVLIKGSRSAKLERIIGIL